MAPSNKVAYVLTGEASGLGQTIDDQTRKIQKLEEQIAKATEKLKDKGNVGQATFASLGKGVQDFTLGILGGVTATKALEQLFQRLQDAAKAVREETARAAKDVNTTLGQSAAAITRNPNLTAVDLQRLQQMTGRIAETSGLGEDAISKVGDAMNALLPRQRLSDEQRRTLVQQATPLVRMFPGESLSDIAKASATITEDLGVQPLAAQNMLLSMKGKVASPTGRAAMVENLKAFAAPAGLRMDDMMALAGTVSTAINDTQGDATSNVIQQLYRKLVADPSAVEKRLGTPLQGGFMDRLKQLQSANAGAALSADDAETMGLGRGPAAALAAQFLLSGKGAATLQQNQESIAAGMNSRRDLASDRFRTYLSSNPAAVAIDTTQAEAARFAVERSRDQFSGVITAELNTLKERMRSEMLPPSFQEAALTTYEAKRRQGQTPSEAELSARFMGGYSSIPGIGYLGQKWAEFDAGVTGAMIVSGRKTESGSEAVVQELKQQTAEMRRQGQTPARPLENVHHN